MSMDFRITVFLLVLFTIFTPELMAQSSGSTSTTTVTIDPPPTTNTQAPTPTLGINPPDSGSSQPSTPPLTTPPETDKGQTATITVTTNPQDTDNAQTSTKTVTISPPTVNTGQTSTTSVEIASSNFGSVITTTATLAVQVPLPATPTPEVNKVVSNDGALRNSKMSLGAYSDNGTRNFANNFTDGDFITVIGEISPDPVDIGKNGELFVVVGSLIQGELIPTYLDLNGNLIHWDYSINSLEPAAIASPLEENLQIRIFEGVLQAGLHRFFFAYKVEDGPLVYTGSALRFKVSE